ncbi:MAG: hypothetical protein AAF125_21420 [Chloroflexota bacterium]
MFKKIITAGIAVIVLTIGAVAVGAQDADGDGEGRQGRRGAGSELVLEYTGLEREALREALQGGATLEELIVANGETLESFQAAVEAEIEARLDAAVAEGRITEEQAAERLAQAQERAEAFANGERPERGERGEGRGPRGGGEGAGPEGTPDV